MTAADVWAGMKMPRARFASATPMRTGAVMMRRLGRMAQQGMRHLAQAIIDTERQRRVVCVMLVPQLDERPQARILFNQPAIHRRLQQRRVQLTQALDFSAQHRQFIRARRQVQRHAVLFLLVALYSHTPLDAISLHPKAQYNGSAVMLVGWCRLSTLAHDAQTLYIPHALTSHRSGPGAN